MLKETKDKLCIQVPKDKQSRQPIERLIRIAAERDRSVSYVALEAILKYVDEYEANGAGKLPDDTVLRLGN